jgi:hypothetical protein
MLNLREDFLSNTILGIGAEDSKRSNNEGRNTITEQSHDKDNGVLKNPPQRLILLLPNISIGPPLENLIEDERDDGEGWSQVEQNINHQHGMMMKSRFL